MVKSMTGYGRSEKVTPTAKCSVEIKSVNHRYLDMSIKLPRKLNMFEADIREVLKDYIQRGKVDVFVSYEDYSKESVNIKYNQEIAAEYMKYFAKMVEDFELDDDIRVSTLARMPEVLVSEDENINEDEIWKLVKEVLLEACDAFVVSRIKEGENLRTDLLEKLEGKKLLVMGGMRISCEIVRQAKKMGIFTYVADYNPIELSPAKTIADRAIDLDITDVDAVVDAIKHEGIEGVIVGFNDMLLPFYADICEKAGLPCYGTREQFEILTSKDRYKNLCRQFGVPTIQEYQFEDKDILYPVLVKPVDSSGSRGITICHDKNELEAAVKIISSFIEMIEESNSFAIIVTHMANELMKYTDIRVDGIEATGLDENYNLIVDRTPKMNYLAKSTPELIIKRMYNNSPPELKKVYGKILEKF